MSKIRVLSDHLANQIAAGEVVERPASVAKELVENSIDAGATRIEIETQAGGRRLLVVRDDGEGMTRDDAMLAFERHATSKLRTAEDLISIATLGFRGEALASIASVARVELHTKHQDQPDATRVLVEGGRLRDVSPVAHPQGTTIEMRDLFFNVPARRKFLRSEATENYHLTNLVTHYALAHPEISFSLTSNGRETLRADRATDLRERAYQIFGADFISNLLEIEGGYENVARIRGYVSAPRERRTSRDAQYLFVNGRYVRDRLVARALGEGYRSVLPNGSYPAALLFLEIPYEEVDVNVHPAKTEVRFRRAAGVSDVVTEAVRRSLARGGYVRMFESPAPDELSEVDESNDREDRASSSVPPADSAAVDPNHVERLDTNQPVAQTAIDFRFTVDDGSALHDAERLTQLAIESSIARRALERHAGVDEAQLTNVRTIAQTSQPASHATQSSAPSAIHERATTYDAPNVTSTTPEQSIDFADRAANDPASGDDAARDVVAASPRPFIAAPPFDDATNLVREATIESLSANIRPLGQLADSFIIATDDEGLLLIDQHVAHERILFDKYRRREADRKIESQHLLIPETFDLSPAQAAAFDLVTTELDACGFDLMRLSGRTLAIKSVPADLPPGEARNLLAEVLDAIEAERRSSARLSLHDRIAASLACRAAVKINTPLGREKQQWLIDRVLVTASPTTCPHGRPVILRLRTADILKGFHRT